jgi:microcystin-dependent protein
MTQPYVGEIRMFGGNFAPSNWAFCNGQTLSISQYQVLYTLIGTTYGGNGTTTFNLPNLQGQLAVGMGQGLGLSNYTIGQRGGTESVTLTTTQMAAHNHSLNASKTTATFNYPNSPTNNVTGTGATSPTQSVLYTNPGSPSPTLGNLDSRAIGMSGGSVAHPNMMPSLCVSFIICLVGIFPSQS